MASASAVAIMGDVSAAASAVAAVGTAYSQKKAADFNAKKAQQEAKQDAETLITRAQVAIQRERDGAIDELRKEFADLTIMAAEKVIEKSIDKQTHRQLIDKVLEESTTLKKG